MDVNVTMMKPTKTRLFIKPFCGWCHDAMHWLERQGVPYEKLNVLSNRQARDEMFQLSGQTLAPVIEVDGHVLADFGADELERWWTEQGYSLS